MKICFTVINPTFLHFNFILQISFKKNSSRILFSTDSYFVTRSEIKKRRQINSKHYKKNNLNIITLSDSDADTDSGNFIDVKEIDINDIDFYKNELEKFHKENFILKCELKDKEKRINDLIKNIEEKNIEYERMQDNYQSLNNEYGKIIQKFKTLRQKLKENNLN